MFVAMHREQVASVRDELDRVQELTRELSDLQDKLAQPSRSADVIPAHGADASSGTDESLFGPVGGERGKESNSQDLENGSGHSKWNPPKPEDGLAAGSPKPHRATKSAVSESDGTFPAEGAKIHVLLTKRIAELQRERQSYWQKILSTLHS
jgi:hypothetical protein